MSAGTSAGRRCHSLIWTAVGCSSRISCSCLTLLRPRLHQDFPGNSHQEYKETKGPVAQEAASLLAGDPSGYEPQNRGLCNRPSPLGIVMINSDSNLVATLLKNKPEFA